MGTSSKQIVSNSGTIVRPFGSLAPPSRDEHLAYSARLKKLGRSLDEAASNVFTRVELLTVKASSPIAAKAVHGRLPVVPSDMP